LADRWVLLKRFDLSCEHRLKPADPLEQLLALDEREVFQRDGARRSVTRIRVAVTERAGISEPEWCGM
jgi:hypothetical protein